MLCHQRRGHVAQPVRQRDLLVPVAAEHLEKLQHVVAGVLDVVAQVLANEADIARPEVRGIRMGPGIEHGHPCRPAQVVLPFVGVGVPVQLSHRAGFHCDQSCRNGARIGEIGAVGDADAAAAVLVQRLRAGEAEDDRIACFPGHNGVGLALLEVAGYVAREDPEVDIPHSKPRRAASEPRSHRDRDRD